MSFLFLSDFVQLFFQSVSKLANNLVIFTSFLPMGEQ